MELGNTVERGSSNIWILNCVGQEERIEDASQSNTTNKFPNSKIDDFLNQFYFIQQHSLYCSSIEADFGGYAYHIVYTCIEYFNCF